MAFQRSNRDTLFPGSTPGKSPAFGNRDSPLQSITSGPPKGAYNKSDPKERFITQADRKLQQTSSRSTEKRLQSNLDTTSSSPSPAKRLRERPNPEVSDPADKNGDDVVRSGRTRAEERALPRVTYHEFMVLDQAGSASIGCDNTRERNLVVIKRLKKIDESSMRRIKPFTSDYVVGIRETYFEDKDLVVIYERMDVSLRQVTSILQGPFKPSQIATICKQLVAGLSYIHKNLSLCHGDLNCSTVLLSLDGMVKIANIGESFIRNLDATAESKRDDTRSLGFVMMELMEPMTFILSPHSTELQNPEDWRGSIKDFLKATQERSLEQLKHHDFLPTEPLAKCLKAHIFCASIAAGTHWDILTLP